MATGQQALRERNEPLAKTEFDKALTINPNAADAQSGARRAALLPEVNLLMRRAKNHQLAGEFDAALKIYDQVKSLDAQTFGLDGALAETRQGQVQERVKAYLSEGFSALDNARLETARVAFNNALRLDPGNSVALGGLEQVVEKGTNSRIDDLRRKARAAEQAEDWPAAAAHYASVLQVDGNIQFARDGRTRVAAQQQAAAVLGNIAAAPEKLSSSELFRQAEDLLAQAQRLNPRGPKLAVLLEQVTSLIEAYRDPVAVTLMSDNLTQVTLSTVGPLGRFERKQVSLRPGAYTLIGSRDGCRDVRQKVVVRPDMQPIDIRCIERL
jgi:tetratricopeptide (TPR) repeat protein